MLANAYIDLGIFLEIKAVQVPQRRAHGDHVWPHIEESIALVAARTQEVVHNYGPLAVDDENEVMKTLFTYELPR